MAGGSAVLTGSAGARLRPMVLSAVMAALALALPIAFHAVGLGSRFLPMLLPLLLNGFLVPLPWAALTGATVPLISSLLTGMPPLYPPTAIVMSFEGIVLGGLAAAIYRSNPRRLWPALIVAVVASRVTGFVAMYLLARLFGLPAGLASTAVFVNGLPGVALQLVVVPVVVRQLQRSRNLLLARHDG